MTKPVKPKELADTMQPERTTRERGAGRTKSVLAIEDDVPRAAGARKRVGAALQDISATEAIPAELGIARGAGVVKPQAGNRGKAASQRAARVDKVAAAQVEVEVVRGVDPVKPRAGKKLKSAPQPAVLGKPKELADTMQPERTTRARGAGRTKSVLVIEDDAPRAAGGRKRAGAAFQDISAAEAIPADFGIARGAGVVKPQAGNRGEAAPQRVARVGKVAPAQAEVAVVRGANVAKLRAGKEPKSAPQPAVPSGKSGTAQAQVDMAHGVASSKPRGAKQEKNGPQSPVRGGKRASAAILAVTTQISADAGMARNVGAKQDGPQPAAGRKSRAGKAPEAPADIPVELAQTTGGAVVSQGAPEKVSYERDARRNKRSDKTIENILEATEKVILESGAERISILDVCAVAHISRGTFYRYFQSQDDLLDAFSRHTRDRFHTKLVAATAAHSDPDERFQALIRYLDGFLENSQVRRLLIVAPDYAMRWFQRIFHDSVVRFQDVLSSVFDAWEARIGVPLDRELMCELMVRFILSDVLVPSGPERLNLPRRIERLMSMMLSGRISRR